MCICNYIHKLLNVAHEVALKFLHCCKIICAKAFLIPRVTSLNIITKFATKLKNNTKHKRKNYKLLNPKIGRKRGTEKQRTCETNRKPIPKDLNSALSIIKSE